MHTSTLPYLWMVVGSFFFALMGALAHAAGEKCAWQLVALSRSVLVFLIVGGWAVAARVKLVLWRPRTLWLRSIAGSLSLVASFYAFTRLNVSTVMTLTNMFPVWVAVLSWPMLGKPPAPRVWLAVLTGVAGVYLIHDPAGGSELAVVIALASSFSTAVAMLGLHRLHGVDPRAVVVHFSATAAVFSAAAFVAFPFSADFDWEWRSVYLLLAVGLTASVGQVLLTKAFAAGEPAKVSVASLTQVVFALLFDVLQGHAVTARSVLGMSLVLLPTAWVMRKER